MRFYWHIDLDVWALGVVVEPAMGIGLLVGPFEFGIRWGH